ncbi:hypothetical protein QBC43DRAFT_339814 [Cladorrhinum sp. PSN259]|nr:hypothetical protein QBC43DRAFT_339814 [Cladorrhinum sp. PSN259]
MSHMSERHQGAQRDIPPLTNGGHRGVPSGSLSSPATPSSPYTTPSATSTSVLTHPTSGALPDGVGPAPSSGSGNSSHSPAGQQYYQHGAWATPGNPQQAGYAYSSSNHQATSYPHRPYQNGLASPSIPQYSRSSPAAPNGDNMTNPSYQDQQQSFPSPVPGGSNGGSGGGGGVAAPQVLDPSLSSHSQMNGAAQPSGLAQPMMAGPAQPGPQQPSPVHNHQGVPSQVSESNYRQPPTPTGYYPSGSTPQQSSFPAYAHQSAQPSPSAQSPTTSGVPLAPQPRTMTGMAPPPQYNSRPSQAMSGMGTYSTYSSIPGPVLSNLHQPGAGLTIINSPYGMTYGQPMYLSHSHHPPHSSHQDRPFRCDQCPQSFNRNHDLKRHKRIHLAVKPFPCLYCEKSFSRKDALKRHKLVKGCGDGERPENNESAEARADDSDPAPGEDGSRKDGSRKAMKQER